MRHLLLLGAAAVTACACAPSPAGLKAPGGDPRMAGAQIVFEERWAFPSTFARVGDGILGHAMLTKPQAFVFIGPSGRLEARQGSLQFPMSGVVFDTVRASLPPLWGRWPDDYFAEAWSPTPPHRRVIVRVRNGVASNEGEFLRILAILPWTEGRTVGMAKDDSRWKRIVWDDAGRHEEPLPRYSAETRFAGGQVLQGENGITCVEQDLVPWEAAVLASGEVVVLGLACSTDPAQRTGHFVIDRWARDGASHVLDPLPAGGRPRWASLCSSLADDVRVVLTNFEDRIHPGLGEGVVVTRRADGWALSPPLAEPAYQHPRSCAVAADGAVWLNLWHDQGHKIPLYRLPAGGQWSEVPVPSPWDTASVFAGLSDGSVWLTVSVNRGGSTKALLRVGEGSPYPVFGFGEMHPLPAHVEAIAAAAPASVAPPPAAGRTAVPTPEEWSTPREIVVKGSSGLGCETKIVREYLRVSCHGKNDSGGTPTKVELTRGEAQTSATAGATTLVVPYVEGIDLAASFSWSDRSHLLVVRWPRGAPRPAVVGVFEGARSPLDHPTP